MGARRLPLSQAHQISFTILTVLIVTEQEKGWYTPLCFFDPLVVDQTSGLQEQVRTNRKSRVHAAWFKTPRVWTLKRLNRKDRVHAHFSN